MTWGPFDLSTRVAVVTGAASGIGYAIAARLREAGASVLVVDRDGDGGRRSAAALAGTGTPGSAAFVEADVADVTAADRVFDECQHKLGAADVLVNNAGIYPIVPLAQSTDDVVERIMRVNVHGTLLMMKSFAAQVPRDGTGASVVNLASMEAFHPSFVGMTVYGASKGAIVSMTKHAALELASAGIRVNAIAPGAIVTEGTARTSLDGSLTEEERQALAEAMIARMPLGRLGDPDDIATIAVFLASAAAGYVTGQTLLADGGLLLT